MTNDALKLKADRYAKFFSSAGVEPAACDPGIKGPNPKQIAAHSMWMCRQVPRLIVEGNEARAREWLRFVEGVVWSMGAMSFKDMTEGTLILGA